MEKLFILISFQNCFHIIFTYENCYQVEAVIHFEDDIEELQQWDQQVFSLDFTSFLARYKI